MLTSNFQIKDVFFYFDGASFVYKLHPMDETRTYGSRACRKKGEGVRITTDGKKEGVNRRAVHLFVAIAYSKAVLMCEQFIGKYNGDSYSKFVHKYFPAKGNNSEGKFFLQDRDPVQNFKELHKDYNKIGCRKVPIPAR